MNVPTRTFFSQYSSLVFFAITKRVPIKVYRLNFYDLLHETRHVLTSSPPAHLTNFSPNSNRTHRIEKFPLLKFLKLIVRVAVEKRNEISDSTRIFSFFPHSPKQISRGPFCRYLKNLHFIKRHNTIFWSWTDEIKSNNRNFMNMTSSLVG